MENSTISMENIEYKWKIVQYKWKILKYKWKRSNIATFDMPYYCNAHFIQLSIFLNAGLSKKYKESI
jgi:hypothetical protein